VLIKRADGDHLCTGWCQDNINGGFVCDRIRNPDSWSDC
jgi:hypothetical protein